MTKREIMTRAWNIRHKAATRYNCPVLEISMSMCLKQAYREAAVATPDQVLENLGNMFESSAYCALTVAVAISVYLIFVFCNHSIEGHFLGLPLIIASIYGLVAFTLTIAINEYRIKHPAPTTPNADTNYKRLAKRLQDLCNSYDKEAIKADIDRDCLRTHILYIWRGRAYDALAQHCKENNYEIPSMGTIFTNPNQLTA